MKQLTYPQAIHVSPTIAAGNKLNDYLLKPLKAGVIGFVTILLILFFINLFSYIIGNNTHFGVDILDILLAGVGFILQMTGTLLKSIGR